MYLSTLKGLQVYNVKDPRNPELVSALPLPHFQNEAMSLGERRNGDAFVLIASTLVAAATSGEVDPGRARFVVVVEVTDPASPKVVGTLETPTRTHTTSCATKSCKFAFSDGRSQGEMSIIDLRNFRKPKVAGTYKSVVPRGPDQDLDDKGILWHVGGEGAVEHDISTPTKPVPLNSTNEEGVENDDRDKSPTTTSSCTIRSVPTPRCSSPSPSRSSRTATCCSHRGGHGRRCLRARTRLLPDLEDSSPQCYALSQPEPRTRGGRGGSISPVDMWYPEDAAVGANCSAHYFDYHDAGFVAQGWHEYATRILDVRNPKDIKQVGFFFTPASETWAAYWAPARNLRGAVNGKDTNIVYTTDVCRGVDVLEVKLPTKSKPKSTKALTAPVMSPTVLDQRETLSRPSKDWGFVCRVPQR